MSKKNQLIRFLDWFGYILSYNCQTRELERFPLGQHTEKNLFILTQTPLLLPAQAFFREKFGLPKLPAIDMLEVEDDLVAFRSTQNNFYLTVHPHSNSAGFSARILNEWEKFIPLSPDMFQILSLLTEPRKREISNSQGEECGSLILGHAPEHIGNIACLGSFSFPLNENLKAISRLKEILSGGKQTLILKDHYGKEEAFTIVIKSKNREISA